MGQYYTPLLTNDDKTEFKTFNSHDYSNGLKLMEHSYIGNEFCNAVMNTLSDNPQHLFWVGDYATYEDCKNNVDLDITEDEFAKLYSVAWSKDREKYRVKNADTKETKRYIINHTAMEYIDLKTYVEEYGVFRQYVDAESGEVKTYIDAVNPLPLLTSLGNGKGGGDYYVEYLNADLCGVWAGDLIEMSDSFPEGYDVWTDGFKEDYE